MFLNEIRNTHQRIISAPIKPECFLTIVIPVRNEAENLSQTLQSLAEQVDWQNRPVNRSRFEIIFLVNNSSDHSAEIIRRWRDKIHSPVIHFAEKHLPSETSNIGYVRRWLFNEAFLRLSDNKFKGGIIATTDGDTSVAKTWIAATLAEIENGAEAVGGRIFIHRAELQKMDAKCRAFHLRDLGYRLLAAEIDSHLDALPYDPWPRHHQHFNGSFAVTSRAFEKAGGIPEVRFLEDVAFYHSLLRVDARFRHSPRVFVQTSGRAEGRTESGLSTQLNEWTMMGCNGDEYLVESASSIERRVQARRKLRTLWGAKKDKYILSASEIGKAAENCLISEEYLQRELNRPQTFGGLYEKILHEQNQIGEWQKENPLEPVEKAIYELRLKLEKFRYKSRAAAA